MSHKYSFHGTSKMVQPLSAYLNGTGIAIFDQYFALGFIYALKHFVPIKYVTFAETWWVDTLSVVFFGSSLKTWSKSLNSGQRQNTWTQICYKVNLSMHNPLVTTIFKIVVVIIGKSQIF